MTTSEPKRSWSSLPTDLLEDILYRIPVGSLVRLKPVCKQWYALLSDKRFIYKHLTLSQEQGFIRVDYNVSIQHLNIETLAVSCLQGPSDIYTLIHCDGLLLCQTYNHEKQLAVWNPVLNRVKRIETSHFFKRWDICGFGYDNVSRDNYKILRFDTYNECAGIYEFKSKQWRSLDYAALGCRGVKLLCNAVSLKGNMYWIANFHDEFFIQSFDFSTEAFKHICCLPFEYSDWRPLYTKVLSCFGGDRLSLYHHDNPVKMIEVWGTNKVTDMVVSWSKYFNVTSPDLPFFFSYGSTSLTHFIHKTRNIMLWCDIVKENLGERYIHTTFYEMGEGKMKKQVETGSIIMRGYFHKSYVNYVPSLVPVPE